MLKQVAPFFIALSCASATHAASLRACIPDHPSAPFSSPSGEAAGQQVVTLAAQRLGDEVQFSAVPWARCLAGIRSGEYDLLVEAEPDESLFAYVAFPQKAGKVDPSRRLGVIDYVLVHKTRPRASWEGRPHREPARPVIIPRDIYAVSRRFDSTGAAPRSLNYDPEKFAALLCHDRAESVVLRRNDVGAVLTGCLAKLGASVQSYLFASTDVYLGVRKALLQLRPELGEALWRELARIRSSGFWPSELVAFERTPR